MTRRPNPAHALDGGSPVWFHIGRHWSGATEAESQGPMLLVAVPLTNLLKFLCLGLTTFPGFCAKVEP